MEVLFKTDISGNKLVDVLDIDSTERKVLLEDLEKYMVIDDRVMARFLGLDIEEMRFVQLVKLEIVDEISDPDRTYVQHVTLVKMSVLGDYEITSVRHNFIDRSID